MRTTGAGYEPFAQVRTVDALVSFEVLAKALVKSRINVSGSVARVGAAADTINGVPEIPRKYGTLERDGWPLDGSCYVMPNSGVETGFWSSAVSDDDGEFSEPVILRYDLPDPTITFGWTFHFDAPGGVWPSRIVAVCYDEGGDVMDEYTAFPDGSRDISGGWALHHFVRDYWAVEFRFYGTNLPRRMVRVAEVDFGVSKHFSRDTIGTVTIKYGLSPDGSSFPAKELSFTFDNSDKQFNVLNPIGVYQYWRNGQVLTARIKVGDEIVNMGMFYVTRAEIGRNRLWAKITAHDQVYQLAEQKFYPGELALQESVPLKTAVEKILSGYALNVDYGGLENEPVSVAVRDTHAKRTMLRYVAQAARATVWIDRDNTVRIRRLALADEPDGEITEHELYDWSGVSISEECTGASLSVERELEKDESGQDVRESYYAGVLEDEGGTVASYENPCVAPGRGDLVVGWLLSVSNWRKKYEVRNRCDPAVEIGDTLTIADAFHNDDDALVTGLEIEFDGGLSAVTSAAREF